MTHLLYQQPARLQSFHRLFFVCAIVLCFFFLTFQSAQAEETNVHLTLRTISKGFTASAEHGSIQLAIWPNSVSMDATLRLEREPSLPLPAPSGMTLVSGVWTFDLLTTSTSAPGPLVLSAPMTVVLEHTSHTLYRKRAFYFDRNKQGWVALRSVTDRTLPIVSAQIRFPYATVAVFEDQRAVEGMASWYRTTKHNAATSNDFPLGSRVRITDLETKKSVEAVIRSTGPFVSGRVTDVSLPLFQKIHPLWREGITRVRIEILSS
ncbi:MAG: septal ring lytic transglycosylase RlpA family protein [bacterium]